MIIRYRYMKIFKNYHSDITGTNNAKISKT